MNIGCIDTNIKTIAGAIKNDYNNLKEKNSSEIILFIEILDNISKRYNLTSKERTILELNYDNIFNQYGYYEETDNSYLITKFENGKYYTHIINEEGINNFKRIYNAKTNLNLLSFNYWYLYNNSIFKINLDDTLNEYPNITLEELIELYIYFNDESKCNKYLEILNNCSKYNKKIVLEIIKPIIFDNKIIEQLNHDELTYFYLSYKNIDKVENIMEDFTSYIKEYTNKCKNNPVYEIKNTELINVYFISLIDKYFINQEELLSELIKKENVSILLKKLLSIKEEIINTIKPITIKIDEKNYYKDVYVRERETDPFYNYSYLVSHNVLDTTEYNVREINFYQNEINQIINMLDVIIPNIFMEKETYKKIFENEKIRKL